MLLNKVVTMSFVFDNNDEDANDALTLKQPSFANSSDENLSENLSSSVGTNSNNLEPPMGQSSDLEDQEEANECEDPAMRQPSDLEVESTEGTFDSASSLSSYYLPVGLLATTLKKKQGMNESQPEFEIGVLPPPNCPPKTLNDGSPDTAATVLCDPDCRPNFSSDESDDDTVDLYSPPFKKEKTLDSNLGSDSSDDDWKETVLEKSIRLRREEEDVEYDDLMKRGERLVQRCKARKVSASGYLTGAPPSRLFCDSDDSNSPVSLTMLPSCFVKYASIEWPAATSRPEVIADEESDDDFSGDFL